jgi:hypothetical protein
MACVELWRPAAELFPEVLYFFYLLCVRTFKPSCNMAPEEEAAQ